MKVSEKKYIRSERANLFEPNVYIGMIVKLEGNLQSKEVEQAVFKAYEANETTMSKIVLEENGDAYYETMESSGCKFFSDVHPWEELLCQSEKRPFALKEGELVRVFLTEENEQAVLFIHVHHLAGDGQSVLVLLNDIINSLSGKKLTYKPMRSVDRSFLEKRAKLFIGAKLYINGLNKKCERNIGTFTWRDHDAIHAKYWAEYASKIEWETYKICELKAGCPENVTVNSYMIAKLLQEHPECKSVGIPVSIREDRGMSNQTSGIVIKHRYNFQTTFEENADRVHKLIYRKLKKRNLKYFILLFMERLWPPLIDAVIMQSHGCYQNQLTEKLAKIMGYTGDRGRDLGVTNLNKIDIPKEQERFAIKDILFVPPKISYAKKVVGISTFADNLTVCYHRMANEKR